jgi:hypothetical protein
MSFIDAARTYEIASRATATRETVRAPLHANFARQVRRLSAQVDSLDGDELWTGFVRRCRRTLRDLSTTPLNGSHPALELASTADHLRSVLDRARSGYPDDLVARGGLVVTALSDVAVDSSNPLGHLIVDILGTGTPSESGVLAKSRQIDAVRSWLADAAPGVRLLTEGEVVRLSGLESLVVVGPSFWFPAHVLSAPRAETLCFVHFDFLRDRDQDTRMFAGEHRPPGVRVRSNGSERELNEEDEVTDAQMLVPTIDWDALARASGARKVGTADELALVPASLFLLADGSSVYLESSDGPTIEVVVDIESGSPRLRSERTRAVGPGDFIVLRSEGGSGDYIPGIADKLMGRRASELRGLQSLWKQALRAKVRMKGFSQVERELRKLGMTSPNIRYRVWRNSLRSRNPNDFRILMDYIGLGDRAGEIWSAMGEIFEAHLRAGQDVRRLLEEAVLATDMQRLMQTGRVDVRLREMDAGTLSVVRVDGRSPEPTQVDEDDLRIMIRVEADLWQG